VGARAGIKGGAEFVIPTMEFGKHSKYREAGHPAFFVFGGPVGTGEGKAMVLVFGSGPHHIDSRE
jgi:hypothetical protein